MTGKLCAGVATNGAGKIKDSKAFCEGIEYRSAGTTLSHPKADNPHEAGSDCAAAWDAGWDEAEAVKGISAIAQADAPCCALSTATVSA